MCGCDCLAAAAASVAVAWGRTLTEIVDIEEEGGHVREDELHVHRELDHVAHRVSEGLEAQVEEEEDQADDLTRV